MVLFLFSSRRLLFSAYVFSGLSFEDRRLAQSRSWPAIKMEVTLELRVNLYERVPVLLAWKFKPRSNRFDVE